jgi:GTPase
MASIFTFDPDPPRVSSPWSTPRTSTPKLTGVGQGPLDVKLINEPESGNLITKLEAEPQEGPTEYKLHLLLRPRRSFMTISTGYQVSGSHRPSQDFINSKSRSSSETRLKRSPSTQARSIHTRQQRLEQLTTQLLWRLQQSSPHHSSSYGSQIAPTFPDVSTLGIPLEVGPVIPGLEETRGALYEIGVADDGTFVGLTKDEMDESINNLRAMAASLGCVVNVVRMVQVGGCEWVDESTMLLRKDALWVAEAYVKPNTTGNRSKSPGSYKTDEQLLGVANLSHNRARSEPSMQLKVTLTGSTMSGKSSLLGSLTTATLDNGRGKSRLSLLKHRHEIASGMTSSVTQELIGYNDVAHLINPSEPVEVVNYASGNVSSWLDIHGTCDGGRLVLISDSAGHPRYRRTTVRGLIGWAPDWTLLCIPADAAEDTAGMTGSTPPPKEVLGVASVDIDLAHENLELCLKLKLPLVVVITKLDLASMTGLKRYLQKVLTTLKAAERVPVIVQNPREPVAESDLVHASTSALRSCSSVIKAFERENPLVVVPIVLTSAVKGTGVSTLHALLYSLPKPNRSIDTSPKIEGRPQTLFHIEDIYSARQGAESEDVLPVLSGHLRYGKINMGDELLLGPYARENPNDEIDAAAGYERHQLPASRSFPGALSKAKGLPASGDKEEWRRVKVTSLRYLRLPVSELYEGQAGTVGVTPISAAIITPVLVRIRKGMVLADGPPYASRMFVAEFARKDVESLSIRHGVVVYIASVKASAKVIAGAVPDDDDDAASHMHSGESGGEDFAFSFEEDEGFKGQMKEARLLVTFQFISSREYVEVGSQVLVMPGGGPGLYGGQERGEKGIASLEGFVGTVVDSSG